MADKFMLTIIDENGSRQWRVPRNAKKHALIAVAVVLMVLLGGGLILSYLVHRVSGLTLDKNIIQANYQNLYNKNSTLAQEIIQKNREIALVTHKIKDLESILKVEKMKGNKIYKVALDALSKANKTLALALIPNGEPVKSYHAKLKANTLHKKSLGPYSAYNFSVAVNTPVYACASGVVDLLLQHNFRDYGKLIRLENAFGFTSIYARLNSIVIKPHTFVQKGELLGYSSASLHYEIRFLGRIVDMPLFMDWSLENFSVVFQDEQVDWQNLFYSIEDMVQVQGYKKAQAQGLGEFSVAQ
ncbi:ToxR-activated protein TagE [Helicobacter sp. NHP19-012]|uniref:ToxR-activated protein TagE n=1 Tax=Helicobacter gastrofelis TaxID=2849642 RepID=A0ABM7SEG7_9HELI|nr:MULTISPECIES: M23 family metallopeptidase [unclassified Helicobacter]BCZ18384.1 ToxR-activated protein TagE [Helicobacter sp. NHP19-012]GMB95669.1 ToxR-activated protein TagE [Helicobacter sp. NHP22-001]